MNSELGVWALSTLEMFQNAYGTTYYAPDLAFIAGVRTTLVMAAQFAEDGDWEAALEDVQELITPYEDRMAVDLLLRGVEEDDE